jgi:peroxin-5
VTSKGLYALCFTFARLTPHHCRVWKELNSQSESDTTMDKLAEWEAEYNKVMNAEREDLDQDWGINANLSDIDKNFGLGSLRYGGEGIPDLPKYEFGKPLFCKYRRLVSETLAEENNPYVNDPNTSLSKAVEMLASGQVSLSEVARMFEAAIQKGDLGEGGHEAWILLGEVRSMDEREDLGLAALREGVQIAKENGGAGGVGLLVCILLLSSLLLLRPSFLLVARHRLYERRIRPSVPSMPA